MKKTGKRLSYRPTNTRTRLPAHYARGSWLGLLLLLAALVPAGAQNFVGRTVPGEAHARQQVREAIKSRIEEKLAAPVLPTKEVAVAVAELLAAQAYGRRHIRNERPYEMYLIDGYWYVTGTLPKKYTRGGTFEVILAASDGRVVQLTHYK